MSLEAQMKELTAALDRNTAALTGKAPAKAPAETTAAPATSTGKPGRPAKPKVTMEALAAKAGELKDAQGMPAVRAMFKEHGAESGKIADVPEKNYAAAIAAIDAALVGDGEEEVGEDDSL